jgi:PTS system glucose-specific IIA component/PTS system N-acetylglucosamine-specific IIA component
MGPGVVIEPAPGRQTAVAPLDGTVAALHPHAYVLLGDGGGVLVHLGIDTVRLEGAGFELHVAKGDAVAAGDPVVSWDPDSLPEAVGEHRISRQVPVVLMERPADSLDLGELPRPVAVGDHLFRT